MDGTCEQPGSAKEYNYKETSYLNQKEIAEVYGSYNEESGLREVSFYTAYSMQEVL